ncbi:MAG: C25 family cysteine peptidase, partial [Planctomycetota bacterium]
MPAMLAFMLLSASFTVADSWLTVTPAGTAGLKELTTPATPELAIRDLGVGGFQATLDLTGFVLSPRKTDIGEFVLITLPDASHAGEYGSPTIPVYRRLFIAPEGAAVSVNVALGDAYLADADVLGATARLYPVQPPIPKLPGALENAPFVYDEAAYNTDVNYAPERATITELGIVRGQRLFMLEIWPLTFNPVAEQITYWTSITADVKFSGGQAGANELSPLPGLRSIVLNDSQVPQLLRRGSGNYLIVVAQTLEGTIASFATAKTAQGFTVTTYSVPGGTSNTVIKNYIASLYANPDTAPDYVLLAGDTDTIPHWIGGGTGSPDTDLPYACMDGSTDWYPDIALGRFPARNVTQLQAIIDKTLYYENGPLADPDYVKRAVFMASEDNYTVSEGTHNWVIENYMTPNEIASDKLYCHTYNATTQQVRDSFNDGRFFGIYSGHGATTYWADGPAFYQDDVNNLLNTNMYPYVMSFACVTGSYTLDECFVETWIRAPNKGAVTIYGSSVNSYWTEDDVLEKRLFDAIYDEEDDVIAEVGPVWIDTQMRYLAEMGSGGMTRRYFEMYNLMGDPALSFPGNCSDAGTLLLDRAKYACEAMLIARVSDCGLNLDEGAVDTVVIDIESDSETGETILLTETNPNSATFEGWMPISGTNAPGVLLVAAGDTITATYADADDGTGSPATVLATALVDCTPPVISNVQVT